MSISNLLMSINFAWLKDLSGEQHHMNCTVIDELKKKSKNMQPNAKYFDFSCDISSLSDTQFNQSCSRAAILFILQAFLSQLLPPSSFPSSAISPF